MKNKVILVTGTNAGIGKSIIQTLDKKNCKVIATSRKKINKKNTKNIYFLNLDVTNEDQWKEVINFIKKKFGKLDVLINNAGIRISGNIENTSTKLWDKIINTNLTSIFLGCKYAVPLMLKNDYGRIVNIASIAGKEGNPNASAYSSTKAGVIGLTKSLGKELADTEIRVNCITPAVVNTSILDEFTQEHINYMIEKIPIGRTGEIEEVANMVSWLSSKECSFSTGAVFDISGGRATY